MPHLQHLQLPAEALQLPIEALGLALCCSCPAPLAPGIGGRVCRGRLVLGHGRLHLLQLLLHLSETILQLGDPLGLGSPLGCGTFELSCRHAPASMQGAEWQVLAMPWGCGLKLFEVAAQGRRA